MTVLLAERTLSKSERWIEKKFFQNDSSNTGFTNFYYPPICDIFRSGLTNVARLI
jgi:hypothetical protein